MIRIRNLCKTYGSKRILDEWSYRFENGKIYGLIGRNGIGKTTLLKCICGLSLPDQGEIITEQGDVSHRDYLNRNINYVSDTMMYYHDLTMLEHLWLVCKVEGYKKEEAQAIIAKYVDRLHMEEYLNYYPSALSKGTLQRMMIIMGFLRKDSNLLLDEPFNGLDPVQLEACMRICAEEREKRCLLISSHDIETLAELCDIYLVFTNHGMQIFTDTVDRKEINLLIGDSYDKNNESFREGEMPPMGENNKKS